MPKAVESVMAGQPDKVCDQIADAIVDEFLRRDPESRVDVKVLGSHGMVMVGGEVNSSADLDLSALVKQVYRDIGYTDDIEVFVNVESASREMATARGATDTVVVNGYATRETREYLPLPLVYAHSLARRVDDLRRTDPLFHWLGPDGKVQVIAEKKKIIGVTILAQHAADMEPRDVQTHVLDRVIAPVIGDAGTQIFINPLGPFVTAGFHADAGGSGRKLSVDFYGGLLPHGDGSLSGKDPGKAERAGAYMARFMAKNLVAQDLAESVFISLAYTMGRSEPVVIDVKASVTKSRGTTPDLTNLVKQKYDLRLEAIVERLDLKKPRYRATAVYGHFGKEGLPWEEITTT
jgi:S-adenosylmethionine synthetase